MYIIYLLAMVVRVIPTGYIYRIRKKFQLLHSFSDKGVKPVGVIEQPVAFTGGSPWEAIKGCAGSSPPIRRLTEVDLSLPDGSASRSVSVSPLVGEHVRYTETCHTGQPFVFNLGGNVELGRLNYGLGAWIQIEPGSQPHTLRVEGPEIESREIFPGSMPHKRSSSGGTELEGGRILDGTGGNPRGS
jgi:hypothetical protein